MDDTSRGWGLLPGHQRGPHLATSGDFATATDIEEWASLRQLAQQALEEALLTALSAKGQALGSLLKVSTKGARIATLRIPGAESEPTWIEMQWSLNLLLAELGGRTWPELILAAAPDPAYRETRERIKESTRFARVDHGLDKEGARSGWWVWHGSLKPAEEPITIDGYVAHCIDRFESAWVALRPAVLRALENSARPSGGHEAR